MSSESWTTFGNPGRFSVAVVQHGPPSSPSGTGHWAEAIAFAPIAPHASQRTLSQDGAGHMLFAFIIGLLVVLGVEGRTQWNCRARPRVPARSAQERVNAGRTLRSSTG